MRLTNPCLWLVCTAFTLVAAPIACASPAAVEAEWLAKGNGEGRAFLTKYEALLRRLEETQETVALTDNARGVRSSKQRSVRLDDCALIEQVKTYTDPSKPIITTLECDNADYHFTLASASPSAPFALRQYAPGGRKLQLWKRAGGLQSEVFYHLKFAIEALAPDKRAGLRAVCLDPKTSLLSIEYDASGGRAKEAVQIDPMNSWCVKRRSVETPFMNTTTDYTYGTVIDGFHFPTGSTSSSTPKPGAPFVAQPMRFTTKVLDVKRTDKTPDAFRLAAFGLPEPVDDAPRAKPTPWHLWLLGAAGACGALSLCFAILRRRLEARRTTTSPSKDVLA